MSEPAPIIWDLVEESLDEAEFLSGGWTRALASAKYTIGEVAQGPEERFLAQLDAGAIGGLEALDRLLLPALGAEAPARVLAAALIICRIRGAPVDVVVEAIEQAPADRALAAARGFALSGHPSLERTLFGLLDHGDPKVQEAALRAVALRGLRPGRTLEPLLASPVPLVRAAALRAARTAGPAARGAILRALEADDAQVRRAAIEAGLVSGLRAAWQACQSLARARAPDAGPALRVLAMSGEGADEESIERALAEAPLRAPALWALGLLGTRRAADCCLDALSDGALGGLAGEAFCAITGLEPTARLRSTRAPAEDAEPAVSEDEVSVEPHLGGQALDELPSLAPDAVAEWWTKARASFDPSARHLGGARLDFEGTRRAFASASTRRRRALAFELEVRSQGAWRGDVELWATEQLALQTRPMELSPRMSAPFRALLQE